MIGWDCCPGKPFFLKKHFLSTKQLLTNMFGRVKMASSTFFCATGVFCACAFMFCGCFRVMGSLPLSCKFFCVVSVFLCLWEAKQFCCFRCVFLAVLFWPAVLLFLRFATCVFFLLFSVSTRGTLIWCLAILLSWFCSLNNFFVDNLTFCFVCFCRGVFWMFVALVLMFFFRFFSLLLLSVFV